VTEPVSPRQTRSARTFRVGVDVACVYPPTTGTLAGDTKAARAVLGGTLARHCKFFDGGKGLQAALNNLTGSGYGSAPGERVPVLCIKQIDAAALNSWMSGLTRTAVLVYQQESDRVADPGDVTAGYAKLHSLRAAHPNKALVKLCLNLTTYKQVDSITAGRAWTDYVQPLVGKLDYVGGDTYVTPNYKPTWDPAYFLSWLPEAAGLARCQWCLPEFGVMNPKDGTEADAAGVYTRTINWVRENGGAWVNYWWASGANGDWRHDRDAALTTALRFDIDATN
jgi:hypothetical protein